MVPVMRASHAMIALCVVGAACPSRVGADGSRAPGDARGDGSVVIGGEAEDHERAVVGSAVMAAARAAGWSLAHELVTKQDAEQLIDCGDSAMPWACMPASLASRGIRRIFVFAVDKKQVDSGVPMVVLTARLITTAPQALVVRQRFCEHCADDRLIEASTELARQLLQDLAVRGGRTILDVVSTPTGAQITLDGHPIGATNATFNTSPGAHVVMVDKAGYRPETRTTIAEEGKTAAVAVTLVPSSGATPAARPGYWKGMLIVGGALAVIAGGVLIDLGTRDGPNEKYRYTGATPTGVVIGIAGAAALATGAYLLWWHRPASSAPAVGIASSGGIVAGWATAF